MGNRAGGGPSSTATSGQRLQCLDGVLLTALSGAGQLLLLFVSNQAQLAQVEMQCRRRRVRQFFCSCYAHAHAMLMLILCSCSCYAHAHAMLMLCSRSFEAESLSL